MIIVSRVIAATLIGCSVVLSVSGCGGDTDAPEEPPPPPFVQANVQRSWEIDEISGNGRIQHTVERDSVVTSPSALLLISRMVGGFIFVPPGYENAEADVGLFATNNGMTFGVHADAPGQVGRGRL